jgi:integrase
MGTSKRIKTNYPGIFYREGQRLGGRGTEKIYYIVFKDKQGKVIEEKAGRQYSDDMTPAKASAIRSERIEGKRLSRKQIREQQKTVPKTAWTFDRIWETYKVRREYNKGAKIDNYRYTKHVKPIFGDKEPSSLKEEEIDIFRINLSKSYKPQTVKHILNLVIRISNFAVTNKYCEGISFKVLKPKVSNERTEDLTSEQMALLLTAIEAHPDIQSANFMLMALYSGMRKSELFRLQWADIDFDRGFIHIRDPKGVDDQIIPLNEATRNILQNHPKEKSEFIFPGKKGGKRVNIYRQTSKIKAAAQLHKDFRPLHGLRHTFASTLASSGQVDMYTLQKLLTHKSPQMTQRYAHLRDETLKRASNLFVDLVPMKKTTTNT